MREAAPPGSRPRELVEFMDVACSTLCFTREPLEDALRRIADMEFSRVDLAIGGAERHVSMRDVLENTPGVLHRIRQGPTISFAAVTVRSPAAPSGEEIDSISHLAKQIAAPVVAIEASPADTPFDVEAARLAELERIVSLHGTVLTVITKTGTITEDPDAAVQLCTAVPGLGLTLDPSHFICGPHQGKPYDQVFPFVRHAHLRDTGRRMDQLQVKVGRGDVEYGRIVTSLGRFDFKGALTVAIEDAIPGDLDVEAEVRKPRLLLESLI